MIVDGGAPGEHNGSGGDENEPLSPVDVADYIHVMSAELARLADGAGLRRLTEALQLAREVAADELTRRTI